VNRNTNRERTFMSTFSNPAMLAMLLGALCGRDAAIAQTPFQIQTGSCGGCSTCLQIGVASATPIRQSGACNGPLGCGAFPSRFADMTSYPGFLQVASQSSDGSSCPQNLSAAAQWNASGSDAGTDVYFTGPAGATSVLTRARYVMSNDSTGDASLQFAARLQSPWANETPMPINVTNFELVSPWTEIGLDFWRTHDVWIKSWVANGSTCCILHLPLNQPVFDLPPGYTANSPTLGIVDNIWHGIDVPGDWDAATGSVPCFSSLHLFHSVSGNLTVVDSDEAEIDLGTLSSVGGDVDISGNDAGQPLTGPASLTINLASLAAVDGNLNVAGNTPDTTVTLGLLSSVNGDLTLETNVAGALDLSGAAVTGNIDIKTKNADALSVATSASGGSTAIAITRDDSLLSLALPVGTLAQSETLTAQRLDEAALPPAFSLDSNSQPIRLDPVAGYHLDVEDATMNQASALVLEVNVAGLPAPTQTMFLSAVADGKVLLARRGDGSGDLYNAFEICPSRVPPSADGCAALELLDQDRAPLPTGSVEPPAYVRFTAAVDELAAYSVAIRVSLGDVNADGSVDIDDLLAVINGWGAPGTNFADVTGNGLVDIDDLLLVINQWG
jgi:hypothetical protein